LLSTPVVLIAIVLDKAFLVAVRGP
jgi:hypothetical protein